MDLIAAKNALRKEFKTKRRNLTSLEVAEKSQQISNNFLTNLLPKIYSKNSHKSFSLYLDAANEVQTAAIAKFFTQNNIKFSYPKITSLNAALEFIIYDEAQKMTQNKFFPKIFEPEKGEKILPDIIVMPLLAFDQNLQRLGMGGGFFDRTIAFLKEQKSNIITIGLAYDMQRFEQNIPSENTDQSLDFIVTEKSIFSRS